MSDATNADSRLLELYRGIIGEPDREIDVYLGFALFFAAVGVGLVALATFAYSARFDTRQVFLWREPAIALAMVALPLFFLSVIVLLPVDRRSLYGGLAGTAISVFGIARFILAYPWQWDTGPVQHSVSVTVTYGIGVAIMVASAGAALVAYQIARLNQPGPADIEPVEEEAPEESYSEEEIERDIEEAMADVDISWGGIEKTETTPLKLNTEDVDLEAESSSVNIDVDRVTRESVDDQVAGLRALKGDQQKQARSESTVDDQTAALAELRERKEKEKKQKEVAAEERGVFGSLLERFGRSD